MFVCASVLNCVFARVCAFVCSCIRVLTYLCVNVFVRTSTINLEGYNFNCHGTRVFLCFVYSTRLLCGICEV